MTSQIKHSINKCSSRNPSPPCIDAFYEKKNKKGVLCCYKKPIKRTKKKCTNKNPSPPCKPTHHEKVTNNKGERCCYKNKIKTRKVSTKRSKTPTKRSKTPTKRTKTPTKRSKSPTKRSEIPLIVFPKVCETLRNRDTTAFRLASKTTNRNLPRRLHRYPTPLPTPSPSYSEDNQVGCFGYKTCFDDIVNKCRAYNNKLGL